MTKPLTTFTTIYRTGGTQRCVWKRCSAVQTYEAAKKMADDCERMGYKALIHRTNELDNIGMPVGWEPAA